MANLVALGTVMRPHGFRGGLVAKTDSGQSSALAYLKTLYIGRSKEQFTTHTVIESAWMPKGWKLELSGIESDKEAKKLSGCIVFGNREDLLPIEAEKQATEFYIHDLLGATVVDSFTQATLGTLTSIEPQSPDLRESIGQDKWWIESNNQLFCIPATSRYIQQVDAAQRRIWLRNLSDFQ